MKSINRVIADPKKRASLEARFWPKVDVRGPDECWPWKSLATHPFGYGKMTAGRGINLKAHHIAYALANGEIPEGKSVLHSCDNPSCCNERHYFIGTQADNNNDMKEKGRMSPPPHSYGEQHHNSKFDKSTADRIVKDKRAAHFLAEELGVCKATIWRHKRRIAWA